MEMNTEQSTHQFTSENKRSVLTAMKHGALNKCPSCGKGKLFRQYLKPHDNCPSCNEELFHHQADDAPPYFTIFILGHILIPLVIYFEAAYTPSLWVHAAIWTPVTIILGLVFLQITKGATIGLQWAFRMHGFDSRK